MEAKMTKRFDWRKSCSCDTEQKAAFHRAAAAQMRKLAKALGLDAGTYDLRSNKGGVAVSGEVTLHHDLFYLQASQSVAGSDKGLLLRTCEGRKDYSGGRNHLLTLAMLDDPETLAAKVAVVQPGVKPDVDTDEYLHKLGM
jgi:hypothetical protein